MVGVFNACPESELQGQRNFHFEVDTFYFSTFYRRSSLAHIHCQGHLERISGGACNPDIALCQLSVLNDVHILHICRLSHTGSYFLE